MIQIPYTVMAIIIELFRSSISPAIIKTVDNKRLKNLRHLLNQCYLRAKIFST
ncbi:MAG: hypothetical protein LBE13_13515 [Bacteroidales bacterium]|nr:hypothetical protein [Bacteroidales bacterium]